MTSKKVMPIEPVDIAKPLLAGGAKQPKAKETKPEDQHETIRDYQTYQEQVTKTDWKDAGLANNKVMVGKPGVA